MELQSACFGILSPSVRLRNKCLISNHVVAVNSSGFRYRGTRLGTSTQLYPISGLKTTFKESSLPSANRGAILCASKLHENSESKISRSETAVPASGVIRAEPFRGKSGSVSFYGLTHHMIEEGKLVSAPFSEEKGSFLWVLGPLAFILSLILPQFLLDNRVEALLKDETLVEIVCSLSFEALFYVGLGIFLLVTDRVQKPYLQFSSKRWSLITGLRGYLSSAFFTMGFKIVAPVFAVYVTWPMLGLPALVSVAPFLVGCAAQFAFEKLLDKRGSSSWPLVPIVFEVYRLYQLTRAAHYVEKLMFSMKGLATTPELLEKNGALVAMLVTFQVLGLVCLWSLLTFLMRLFPSRPVAENY